MVTRGSEKFKLGWKPGMVIRVGDGKVVGGIQEHKKAYDGNNDE